MVFCGKNGAFKVFSFGLYLKTIRICHASPRGLDHMAVEGKAVVHAPDSIRHPAIACCIHESAGHDVGYLIHACNPKVVVPHSSDHASHKRAMPILVLYIAVLASIHKVGTIHIIDDTCNDRSLSGVVVGGRH